jgi:hypothetical protein
MFWPLQGISYRSRESVSVAELFYNLFMENVTTYYNTELLCSGKSNAWCLKRGQVIKSLMVKFLIFMKNVWPSLSLINNQGSEPSHIMREMGLKLSSFCATARNGKILEYSIFTLSSSLLLLCYSA